MTRLLAEVGAGLSGIGRRRRYWPDVSGHSAISAAPSPPRALNGWAMIWPRCLAPPRRTAVPARFDRLNRRGIVFEQAENRLHTIKAMLVATIGSD